MSTKLSIEEKVYQKILCLQANDQFMADVLNLRERGNHLEEVETEDCESIQIFYSERWEFDNDIATLRKKYNLSSIYQRSLKLFVSGNLLVKFHTISNDSHVRVKLIPEIEGWPVTTSEYDQESGQIEEVTHFPDNWDAEQFVAIEIFPETTIKDIADNWSKIAKERDRLYGIKREREERTVRANNLERDLEIRNLRKEGKTYKEIASIINNKREKGAKRIGYEDISKIIERLEKRANGLLTPKES